MSGKRKKIRRIIVSILLIIMVVILVFFNQIFAIKNIVIEGNYYYSKEEINEFFELDSYSNSLLFFLTFDKENSKSIPFIEDVKVDILSFNDVRLRVIEKEIIGCLEYMGMYLYFNKDGILIESSEEKADSIPVVKGLDYSELVLHEKIPIEDDNTYKDLLNIMLILRENHHTKDNYPVNEVHIEDNEYTLVIGDIRVLLGTSYKLNEKIDELNSILPEIQAEKGQLNLKTVEQSKPRIVFEKED